MTNPSGFLRLSLRGHVAAFGAPVITGGRPHRWQASEYFHRASLLDERGVIHDAAAGDA
jgi:hypothetical protein